MKSKITIFLCIISIIICLVSCGKTYGNTIVDPDWPLYSTGEELVGASTNVFLGKVTDISFEIIDYETGIADRSFNLNSNSRMLYTIYSVEVVDNYKGETHKPVQISVWGGIAGYNEELQYKLLKDSGLSNEYSSIPIIEERKYDLKSGENYIFCTVKMAGEYYLVVNPTQFAFELNSDMAKNIMEITKAE